jgi:predicted nucleotidyltransferase
LAAQRYDLAHGIYTLSQIRLLSFPVFKKNPVRKAILFGSYAKGLATPTRDLDLGIDTDQKGLAFFAIADELEQVFHKKVDLFRLDQLEKGGTAEKEVVKTGLRIYVGR